MSKQGLTYPGLGAFSVDIYTFLKTLGSALIISVNNESTAKVKLGFKVVIRKFNGLFKIFNGLRMLIACTKSKCPEVVNFGTFAI